MSGSAPHVITSLMQCAAMSAPQARSAPRLRATTGFVPIESVEAASRRRSSSGWRPAKAPNPRAPVDSTAARRRSTIPSAVASETPAAAYVRSSLTARVYEVDRNVSDQQLGVQLRPALRPARQEPDERVADSDVVPVPLRLEQLHQRRRLLLGLVREQVQLAEHELVGRREQVVQPLARRMHLEPVAGVRGDEGAPAAVRLD